MKWKSGGGSGDGSALAGVDGLVALAVGGRIVAGDVGRQRDVADLFDAGEEVVDGGEADVALAEFAAGDDLGLEFVVVRRRRRCSPTPILRPGRTRHSHSLGSSLQLAGQQDFDAAAKEIARRGIVRADGLGFEAGAASIEAGGKYARVVEDDEIAGAEEIGEIAESGGLRELRWRRKDGADARRRDRAAAAGRSILREVRNENRKPARSRL